MLKIGESFEVKVLLLNDSGVPTTGSIAYTVYDESDTSFATGTMTAIAGVIGLYTMSFTPDAAGEWTVRLICLNPVRYAAKVFSVGKGVEQDTYNAIIALNNISESDVWSYGTRTLTDPNSYKADVSALALEATLFLHDTAIKVLLAIIQSDLDNPNQYKADVSALALESTLTSIKGGGWSSETLKVIYDAIAALNDLAQSDILGDATPFNGADIATILSEIQHGTYGLSALETLVDEVETLLKNATYGLQALDTELGTLATSAALSTHDTDIKAILNHATYGLSAIETLVDDVEGKTNSLPADPASQSKIIGSMDFKSLALQITITSTAGDRGLVDVVVSRLPSDITIIAVEGMFYCDTVENTYDGINYLESTKIQVKKKTAGTDRDAVTLEANKIFRFTEQALRGGTALTPDWATATDAGILAEVDGNGTYQMWFDVGESVQNNIVLDGAVFMLRIWFY